MNTQKSTKRMMSGISRILLKKRRCHYGKYHDWGIQYGSEHYFIPEGTGSKVESEARFATVRVGKNGDAIVTKSR